MNLMCHHCLARLFACLYAEIMCVWMYPHLWLNALVNVYVVMLVSFEQSIPHFRKELAVGLGIKGFAFLNTPVPNDTKLNELDKQLIIKHPSKPMSGLESHCLQVLTHVLIRIYSPEDDERTLTPTELVFDNFDPETITVNEILNQLPSTIYSEDSHFLVREYPTCRPFLCDKKMHAYGFRGEVRIYFDIP